MNNLLERIKYPKLLLLIATFVLAYIIFSNKNFTPFHNMLLSLGYFGSFITGILFVYGFTAAPATAILLILAKEQNIIFCALIAGLGTLVGDLLIFKFIRGYFRDEIEKIKKERLVRDFRQRVHKVASRRIRIYMKMVLAGFIIASPLPDELGVALLAASHNISTKVFSIISYVFNTAGIFVLLFIGTLL